MYLDLSTYIARHEWSLVRKVLEIDIAVVVVVFVVEMIEHVIDAARPFTLDSFRRMLQSHQNLNFLDVFLSFQ